MSITNELRKYAGNLAGMLGASVADVKGALEEIADRIEAKLEDYIPLPKDADGVTIRIGDELESVHSEDGTVAGIRYYEGGRTLIAVRPHGWDTAAWNDSIDYTHAKPDTWEAIIEDAAKNIYPNGAFNPCWDEVRDELVERCKRLAGEDA